MIEINQFKKEMRKLLENRNDRVVQEILNKSCIISKTTPGFKQIAKAEGIIAQTIPDAYINMPYLITTQNQRYLDSTLPENASSACVILGSGDTVFELVSRGINQIEAIDINDLQMMIYKLRYASLLTLSAKDYINFLINCYNHRFMSPEVFKNVKEGFSKNDIEAINFWECILSVNSREDLIEYFFKGVGGDSYKTVQSLSYLRSKSKYYELRDKIEKAKISIQVGDVISYLKSNPSTKFDYIDITNILLFIFQSECENNPELLSKIINDLKIIYENNLNINGVFVLDYLFGIIPSDLTNNIRDGLQIEYIRRIYKEVYEQLQETFGLESYTHNRLIDCFGNKEDTVLLTRKK